MPRGKLIVIYGMNNIGKTTQANLLVARLENAGVKATYLKFPLYDLHPSGPMLNNYLREGNAYRLSPREAQLIYILNRTQYQHLMEKTLTTGIWVVAEDYIGTGLAWGVGAGVDQTFLETMNSHLLAEDVAFLITGNRFLHARETRHAHENDQPLSDKVEKIFLSLAEKRGWFLVSLPSDESNTAASIETLSDTLWISLKHSFPEILK
ncbi:MAG: hypothetical protein HY453_02405 [Parcubacteria group bacterium]|nr:hypothetical protein [Parcubacteria group bacterium]